ncbi:MAG: RNA methyltransferase [Methanobrevibacter sp.]|uniref:RNA methyltransferase n=1 Tax=Methanobrevibacter sp. TaxID=66852 RepID=UPI0026E0544F|nr:RNA methyltransferase [Methanobrevibacter sp.]MDO5848873.1 RNA methyltransferase [Methanobrevibacter sp.]
MGDAAVSEQSVVNHELNSSKNENEEKTDAKETSTKKAKKKSQSSGKEISITLKDNPDEESLKLKSNIYVVFVECETPGNIGFLARTMANFGLSKLVLINPPELKKEAFYQAMHAQHIVENAMIFDSLDEFYKNVRIDFKVASTGVAGGSYNLSRIPIKPEELGRKLNPNNNTAIIFGREGNGLTNKEIESCDITVSIPTDPTYPIMNISHAAAIILYELFKNRNEFPVEGLEESTSIEKEYLLKDMEEIIDALPIPDHKKKTGLRSFKNIINRAFITGREAHTLKGILRRLKMNQEE